MFISVKVFRAAHYNLHGCHLVFYFYYILRDRSVLTNGLDSAQFENETLLLDTPKMAIKGQGSRVSPNVLEKQ